MPWTFGCEPNNVNYNKNARAFESDLTVHLITKMFEDRTHLRMQTFKVRIQMQIQMDLQLHGGIWMWIQMHYIQIRSQMYLHL